MGFFNFTIQQKILLKRFQEINIFLSLYGSNQSLHHTISVNFSLIQQNGVFAYSSSQPYIYYSVVAWCLFLARRIKLNCDVIWIEKFSRLLLLWWLKIVQEGLCMALPCGFGVFLSGKRDSYYAESDQISIQMWALSLLNVKLIPLMCMMLVEIRCQ